MEEFGVDDTIIIAIVKETLGRGYSVSGNPKGDTELLGRFCAKRDLCSVGMQE